MKKRENEPENPSAVKTRKRGKVFYRLLFSYFVILLIPLMLSLAVYRQTHFLLRQEAERANELLLNQMKAYCDEAVKDALSITSLVSNNDRLKGLIYEKGPVNSNIYYRSYSAVKDFSDYLLANRNILSFCVYIKALDLMISPFGFYSTESYYENVLNGIDYTYDEWLSYFTEIRGRYYSPFKTMDLSVKQKDTLAVFSPIPNTEIMGNARGACVVELDLSLFTNLMKDTVWTDRSILAIYDRDRGILASSREEISQEALNEKVSTPELFDGSLDTLEWGDMKYAVLVTRSDVVPWSYISLIPEDIYNDMFIRLFRLYILFFLFFSLIGGLLVFLTARNRYKPIQDILKLIQPEGKGDITLSNDEYNLISRGIQLTLDEDNRLRQEMKANQPILQQREMRRLLKGEILWDPAEEERSRKLGLSFPKNYFLLVLMDIELEEDAPPSLMAECLSLMQSRDVINEDTFLIKDLDGHVGYFINRDKSSYYEILEMMTCVREEIEEMYSVAVAIGLSRIHDRSEGFKILYREALRALEYRLVKGRSVPILYDDILKSTHTYYYPLDEERKFIAAIRSGSEQDAFDILDHILKTNFDGTHPMSVEMARCLMHDLIATLVKGLESYLSEETNFWFELRPIHRLTACKSFESLKVEMEDILYHVCNYIKKGQKSHNEKLKDEIMVFVEEHYADPGLCADMIADQFERNSAYLARFFKEQAGLGLAAHIKHLRVQKSLALLEDDKKTVATMAGELGFSNTNAYIRAFKENMGITPGQYREKRLIG